MPKNYVCSTVCTDHDSISIWSEGCYFGCGAQLKFGLGQISQEVDETQASEQGIIEVFDKGDVPEGQSKLHETTHVKKKIEPRKPASRIPSHPLILKAKKKKNKE